MSPLIGLLGDSSLIGANGIGLLLSDLSTTPNLFIVKLSVFYLLGGDLSLLFESPNILTKNYFNE